ncbi:MAG: heparan-alpha-glucosaminide N-acetyltransferase [Candidatus Aminicenantales bacterium]
MPDQNQSPTDVRPARDPAAPRAPRRERIWEIDFLRGLSIILMVGYHLLYDLGEMVGLESFLGFNTDLSTPAWLAAQYFFAALFVVLSGVSSTLSRSNVRRSLKLLAVAILISVVTFFFNRAATVHFGILHCLGVSILLYGLDFEKAAAAACAVAGAAVIGAGLAFPIILKTMTIDFNWLLALGIHTPDYSSFDYFPLLPWFGAFLAGAALGKSVYAAKRSLVPLRLPTTFVNVAGRHSLLIYIVHQPVILAALYLLGLVR